MRKGQKMTPEQRENVRRAQNDPKVQRRIKLSYPKKRRSAASKQQWENLTPEEKEAKMLPARRGNKAGWDDSITKENWIRGQKASNATPQGRRRRSKAAKKRWKALPPEKRQQLINAANKRRLALLKAGRQQESANGSGGNLAPDTTARILLAAHYGLEGFTAYTMAAKLYPAQTRQPLAFDATKKFLKRHASKIKAERTRLATLPEAERAAQVAAAVAQTKSEN